MALSTLLTASLLLAAPASGASQETVTLRMNPPAGTVRYEISTDLQQEMMGQNFGFGSTVIANIELSKVDGGFRMVMTTTDVKLNIPAGSPMEGAADQMIDAIKAGRTTLVFDELGTVKNLQMDGFPDGSSAPGAASFGALSFPKDPIKVGDTWTQTMDMKGLMTGVTGSKTTIPITHRLEKIENGQATIVSTSKGDLEMEMQGQTMTMSMNSTSTTVVDIATGMMVSATSEGTNNMTMMGMTIPQKVKSTMKRLP